VTRRLIIVAAVLTMLALLPASAGATARYGPARLASLGPSGGNGPFGVSNAEASSGVESRAYFTTPESLVPEDGDTAEDVYATNGRGVSLASVGTPTAGPALGAFLAESSADGTRVFFHTYEVLAPADADTHGEGLDVYERVGGETRLISTVDPACADCSFTLAGLSEDGRHAFFTDGRNIYENFDGVVALVNTGPTARPGSITSDSFLLASSADGSHVFFHSEDNLVAEDQDNCGGPGVVAPCSDFFERTGGVTRLISTGPAGGNASIHNPLFNSFAASRDGSHAVFATEESLVPEDTDGSYDLYDRAGPQISLVSTGPSSTGASSFPSVQPPAPLSDDGTSVVFTTNEQLVPEDQDASQDVYLRSGGTTTLVSTGPADGGAVLGAFPQITPAGDRVFFRASASLTARDTDALPDLYEWSAGRTKLVSIGPAGGNGDCAHEEFPSLACGPGISDVSRDGKRLFFFTEESLVAADRDQEFDVYVRHAGKTVLVTGGRVGGSGPFHASGLTGGTAASPSGKTYWFTTAERLVSQDADDQTDLYVSTEQPKPRCRHRPRPRHCDRD
jgi:hypothetical protein